MTSWHALRALRDAITSLLKMLAAAHMRCASMGQ